MISYINNFLKKLKWKKEKNIIILTKKDGKKIFYPSIKGLNILFRGKNSSVELFEPIGKFKNVYLDVEGSGSRFIKKSATNGNMSNMKLRISDNSKLSIGENFRCHGGEIVLTGSTNVIIGDNCLFSDNISIRTDDGHAILDMKTKEAINPPENVYLGNKVWLGHNVNILKGVSLSDNVVVGLGSVVTKSFTESNIVLAGVPAKIIKRNIEWNFMGYNEYVWRRGECK